MELSLCLIPFGVKKKKQTTGTSSSRSRSSNREGPLRVTSPSWQPIAAPVLVKLCVRAWASASPLYSISTCWSLRLCTSPGPGSGPGLQRESVKLSWAAAPQETARCCVRVRTELRCSGGPRLRSQPPRSSTARGDVSAGSDGRVPTEHLPPQHAPSGCSTQHDRDEDPALPGLSTLLQRPQLLHLPGHHLPQPGRHGRVLPGHQKLHGSVLGDRLPAAELLRHSARD